MARTSKKNSAKKRWFVGRFFDWLGRRLNPFSDIEDLETEPGEDGYDDWLDTLAEAAESEGGEAPGAEDENEEGLLWPQRRQNLADAIWGEGYITPGGEEYVKSYLPLLAMSEKQSLLLLGAGPAGIGHTLVEETGVWVTGYEDDEELAKIGDRRAVSWALQRRAPVKKADYQTLKLKPRSFDFAMSLERLYTVEHKKELLANVVDALRTDGELVYTDLVLPDTRPPNGAVKEWIEGETHTPHPWPVDVTQAFLGTLNLDVRPYTDITREYRARVLGGWLRFLDTMNRKKLTAIADEVIEECAYWARLVNALDSGGLKVFSFHAYKLMDKKK